MSFAREEKPKIIDKYAIKTGDTGSPEVQIALLTDRILSLADHLETHKKDMSSRRGLLVMVGRRRRLLDYLKTVNTDRYEALIASLGLRR